MKKLLRIVVLGLFFTSISAFFHNPKDKALENCADFNWLEKAERSPSIIKKLSKEVQEEIYNSKDLSISRGNIEAGKLNETNATHEWKTFAVNNFLITEEDIIRFGNIAYKLSLGFEKLEITDEIPELKLKKGELDFEDKKREFDRLYNVMVQRMKARRYFEKFFRDRLKNVFVGLKLKKKFKEESYQNYFEKCEIRHNKLPSTFMQKWGD